MDLSTLADFNLVVHHGGFSRASRVTGRPKATLSRKVLELEQSLGVQLLQRGSRSLRLTEEGQNLFNRTNRLLSEISEAGEDVRAGIERPSGRLRVSAPILFSHLVLGRMAADFARAYPEVKLEIVAQDKVVDLIEDNFDLLIWINPSADEKLTGCCFARDHRVVVAAPEMVQPRASGKTVVPTVAISHLVTQVNSWRIVTDKATVTLIPEPVLSLSSILMVKDAVLAGAGAALLPNSLVAFDVEAGRLNSWGAPTGHEVELWVLYSAHRLVSSKVSAFVQFLTNSFPDKSLLGYIRKVAQQS